MNTNRESGKVGESPVGKQDGVRTQVRISSFLESTKGKECLRTAKEKSEDQKQGGGEPEEESLPSTD